MAVEETATEIPSTKLKCEAIIGIHERQFDFGPSLKSIELSSDDWRTLCQISDLHSKLLILSKERIELTIDFSELLLIENINRIAAVQTHNLILEGQYEKLASVVYDNRDPTIKLTIEAKANQSKLRGMITDTLCDVFLIANLANPGVLSFSRTKIDFGEDPIEEFEFTAHLFDIARTNIDIPQAFELHCLDLKAVSGWYFSVHQHFNHLPTSATERCIFALMNMTSREASEIDVIWIFYALESLYKTKPGENFSALVERISQTLELSEADKTYLKRGMRALYDMRSSIVHGGHRVMHPLWKSELDSRMDESWSKFIKNVDFGFLVILKTLQRMIQIGAVEIHFSTSIEFKKMDPQTC